MTRCYEYYCLFVCTPEKCEIATERGTYYVKAYIKFMQEKGVSFDKAPDDKTHFLKMVDDYGTEGQVTRLNKCSVNDILNKEWAVILCDAPWKYNFAKSGTRRIGNQYPELELETIKEMKIPSAEDAVLFMWATAPKLRDALEVMDAWGFEYKTHGIWDKCIIGMGYWFRGQHELLLIGTRGNVRPPTKDVRWSSIIKEQRTTHSTKPIAVYEMIEQQFPEAKKIELFARSPRQGWTVWGDEV